MAVVQVKGFGVRGSGFGVQGSGFRVQGSGFRVQGSGFRVQGSGFRVQGSGFRVQGSGFRVRGSGFGVRGSKDQSGHRWRLMEWDISGETESWLQNHGWRRAIGICVASDGVRAYGPIVGQHGWRFANIADWAESFES